MSASHWFSKSYTEAKKRFHESVNQLESLGHQVQRDSLLLDLQYHKQYVLYAEHKEADFCKHMYL